MEDINNVEACLGCSTTDAAHYLKIFNGDVERTVKAVLENYDDYNWWGHPWNKHVGEDWFDTKGYQDSSVKSDMGQYEHLEARSQASSAAASECKEDEALLIASTRKDNTHLGVVSLNSDDDSVNEVKDKFRSFGVEDIISANELVDDWDFYQRYKHLVDNFVDTVCGADTTKRDLRVLIAEADKTVSTDTASELKSSDLVNRPSFRHVKEGRTPLNYAVAKNLQQRLYDLIDLGAAVSKTMPSHYNEKDYMITSLVIAATNEKRDGTEMVRILLSKGANPDELSTAEVDEMPLGLGMKYWLDKARRVGIPNQRELNHMKKTPPMDRLHEIDYSVVGEEAAVSVIQEALAGRFGNPQGNRKPLVLLLLGPPGHGKTYFSSNAARSLVGEDNFLFIPCQSIRDDADLFGSRLGGARDGKYSSDGQLTGWLRERQKQKCIVFLDEFEKIQGLTSSLGWDQAKKIYQSFLEPWNDGKLSDQSASSGLIGCQKATSNTVGGAKIDCSQCIWIMTANWGQRDIIDFCDKNKGRMQKKVEHKDVAWIQKNLVAKILQPLCIREFGSVHEDIKALCRRIDVIVPFLPFTKSERKVVADTAVTERFSLYREPCVLDGPEEKRRSFGNLHLRSTKAFVTYAAGLYDPMQGASAMLAAVQRADGKFQMMSLRDQLGLTDEQKERVTDTNPSNAPNEPEFWVHYDKDSEEVCITQFRPIDDNESSECSDANVELFEDDTDMYPPGDTQGTSAPEGKSTRVTPIGAADDAF